MTSPYLEAHGVRIGLWGASGSGKTTYLGSMRTAVTQASKDKVAWTVRGADEASVSMLAQWQDTLTGERAFPEGTTSNTPMRWIFQGERQPGGRPIGIQQPSSRRNDHVQFALDVLDVPGGLANNQAWLNPQPDEPQPVDDLDFDFEPAEAGAEAASRSTPLADFVEHLAGCDGILYLLDPVTNDLEDQAFQNFSGLLAQIEYLVATQNRLRGTRLPHFLAFCVTKFDDPVVLEMALGQDGIQALKGQRPPIKPTQEDARRCLEMLKYNSANGGVANVLDAVGHFFLPGHVRYFATSSIGFRYGPDSRFDPGDYLNTVPQGNKTRIRGSIRPFNVLEPLVWLVSRIREAQRKSPANGF
ncbi:hypothetical protein [Cryptosporangium sp. NPDC051539]|uniref:hypothetical protein n=1 Tax=Cryptosporangium sp. NPDC051539 TaxID=3363962 RepID=UPI00379FD2AD